MIESAQKEKAYSELEEGIKPYSEGVDGNQIALEIKNVIGRYMVCGDGEKIALTLWVFGTYCFDAFRIFPRLLITSPEKRCGKTNLMEILSCLTHRALPSSNASSAVVFRAIDHWHPTLLIDEADTFLKTNEELQGIINSGHNRSGAHVLRVEGDNNNRAPKKFSTWAPMAIAMIKKPQGTLIDRSVIIHLRRRLQDEIVEKMPADLFERLEELRQKLKRWSMDCFEPLKRISVNVPNFGNDRAQDNWTPLFIISDQLGDSWPKDILNAYQQLTGLSDDESFGVMLLADIWDIFCDFNVDKLHATDLINKLNALDERPWNDFQYGRPFSKNRLAKMLKDFGIHSKQSWIDGRNRNGYQFEDFEDAFNRYLPHGGTLSSKTLECATDKESEVRSKL